MWPSSQWWKGFGSRQLDAYIVEAQRANQDLAAAVARVREADAQAEIAGAALLPSIGAAAGATQQRSPTTGGIYSTHPEYTSALNASYEIDFWGKNRAAETAAVATATASRYDRATVALTVVSNVATTYLQSLELRDRIAVARQNVASARAILDGLQRQQTAGIATALDVAQQDTTVSTLSAAIPPLRQQLRQITDALAILLGRPPESLDIDRGGLADLSQPVVRPGLPSGLLARRPDIAEAEAQLVAANANIVVARAAFFPSITLTGSGGFESTALEKFINPSTAVFSLAAGVTQPIFEGGALEGQYHYSQARYDELVANYRKAVLSAFGNVEDALAAVRQTAEQVQRQQDATAKAQRAHDFSLAQMHAGTVNILTVLNTEGALFTAEDALVQAKFAHLQSLVSLFNALGGGWQQG